MAYRHNNNNNNNRSGSSCQTQNIMWEHTMETTTTKPTTKIMSIRSIRSLRGKQQQQQTEVETLKTDKICTSFSTTNTTTMRNRNRNRNRNRETGTSTNVATTASHRKQNIRRVRNIATAASLLSTPTTTTARERTATKRTRATRGTTATATALSLKCTRCLYLLLLCITLLAAHTTLASATISHKTASAASTTSTTRPAITIIKSTATPPATTTTTRPTITIEVVHTPQQQQQQQQEYSQPLLVAPAVGAETEVKVGVEVGNVNGDGDVDVDVDSFRPIIPADLTPEDISRNVFTPNGQYRVFESAESDLRATSTMRRRNERPSPIISAQQPNSITPTTLKQPPSSTPSSPLSSPPSSTPSSPPNWNDERYPNANEIPTSSDKELEALLSEYMQNFFEKGSIEPLPGLVFALQKNGTHMGIATPVEHSHEDDVEEEEVLIRHVRDAVQVNEHNGGNVNVNIPRALQTGRLLFFAGLKKVLWPVFMGLQILKSLLFALLLPTLIGSVGKLLGKGIISGSAPLFIRPMDAPQDVDFKDNSLNFDDDNKFAMGDFEGTKDDSYAYNQPEASQTHNQYAFNAAGINQQALSRYGNEKQHMQDSYLSALQSLSSASFKNSNSISGSSSAAGLGGGLGGVGGGGASLASPTRNNKPVAAANVNTFQTFQKVPASSLLLSNYDPFYSPLLSRLDSVFAQLKLNSESEVCREKLICLMYANPAKYAPYSNLVSAQLSRELNELRKPTSDNPDILRFFKYMRAAKDGQDGIDCEKTFDDCDEFKDFENPAMVSTYHDINKLVQARKLT